MKLIKSLYKARDVYEEHKTTRTSVSRLDPQLKSRLSTILNRSFQNKIQESKE